MTYVLRYWFNVLAIHCITIPSKSTFPTTSGHRVVCRGEYGSQHPVNNNSLIELQCLFITRKSTYS